MFRCAVVGRPRLVALNLSFREEEARGDEVTVVGFCAAIAGIM